MSLPVGRPEMSSEPEPYEVVPYIDEPKEEIGTVSQEALQEYVDSVNAEREREADREWEESHSINCIII